MWQWSRRVNECDALRDHALRTGRFRRGDEVLRALDADARIGGESGVERVGIGAIGQIGQLMDHDIRPRIARDLHKRFGVEHIDHRRDCARARQFGALGRRACRTDHLMARAHQQKNERTADDAGGASQKNTHEGLHSIGYRAEKEPSVDLTSSRAQTSRSLRRHAVPAPVHARNVRRQRASGDWLPDHRPRNHHR